MVESDCHPAQELIMNSDDDDEEEEEEEEEEEGEFKEAS